MGCCSSDYVSDRSETLQTLNSKRTILPPSEPAPAPTLGDLDVDQPDRRHTSNHYAKVNKSSFVTSRKEELNSLYIVKGLLGEGSYGKVFDAQHKVTGTHRAIKFIRKENLSTRRQESLLNEVAILRRMVKFKQDHPYIIRIFEVVQETRFIYIVTELCTGGELFARIIKSSGFSEGMAASYMHQVMQAVHYLHANNIVHCDLKPENLMLASNDESATVKLIDFGTSQIFDPVQKLDHMAGTPYYIAPEILSKLPYDNKVDIWSCGVILYMMLSGRPPFNGRTRAELYWNIRNCNYNFEREEWAHVSDPAKDLIRGMLTVNPANRVNARDVLESKWFRLFAHSVSPCLSMKALENLTKFQYSEGLRRAALTYLACQTEFNNEEDISKLFLTLDTNGDGKLSRDEITQGFTKLSLALAVDVDDVLKRCDADCNGYIEYTEFIAATTDWRKQISESNLQSAFKAFDLDANGQITFEEFMEVIGDDANGRETWDDVLAQADVNGDGMIDFKEFRLALEGRKKRRKKRIKSRDVRRAKSHQPKSKLTLSSKDSPLQ